ncbi:hypothetical protein NQZ68_010934 [Dissostichus eleginoides]|nr:hypothetical protein NQZ68_010934 [Dissostichus eleginoides]
MSVNSLSKLLSESGCCTGDKYKCEKEREGRMAGKEGAFNSSRLSCKSHRPSHTDYTSNLSSCGLQAVLDVPNTSERHVRTLQAADKLRKPPVSFLSCDPLPVMFSRSYKKRDSSRSLNRAEEPHRGQPCLACGEQCPGFALHKWSGHRLKKPDFVCRGLVRTVQIKHGGHGNKDGRRTAAC